MYLNIDFETYSTTDLRQTGVYRYVEDPLTNVWCMAWKLGNDDVELWVPGEPLPPVVVAALEQGVLIRAWNAQFERLVWNTVGVEKHGFPRLENEQFICTMADALAMGLPAALNMAAKALRLNVSKDMGGNRLAIQMAKPRTKEPLTWWNTKDRLEKLYAYCKQDVVVEHKVMERTRRMGSDEREVYLLDQRINDRGVHLDTTLVRQARKVALEGVRRANETVCLHTGSEVEAITQVGRMQHWLNEQGCDIENLKASTLQRYLAENEGLDPAVRKVLVARSEAGKASVSKLDRMLQVVAADGCMHGLLQYHGAATGRWAGRLVQPQNFPRGNIKNAEQYIDRILNSVEYPYLDIFDNPVDIVSSLLRSMLVAKEGHEFYAADFSAIEARVLAWLAGQEDLVEMFAAYDRGEGEEVYVITANEMGTTRQGGKAIILGAGYGMGHKTFVKSARDMYGLELTLARSKEFIDGYRERYSCIPQRWKDMNFAVLQAVSEPGTVIEVGLTRFVMRSDHLWMILPSGRPLCYHAPRIIEKRTPWGSMAQAVQVSTLDSFTRKWTRRDLYGGLLVENEVQAVSRDLMVHCMFKVEEAGYPVIMTVHDEVVAQNPNGHGSFEEYIQLMKCKPEWAEGCPVQAAGWHGHRYRKD